MKSVVPSRLKNPCSTNRVFLFYNGTAKYLFICENNIEIKDVNCSKHE